MPSPAGRLTRALQHRNFRLFFGGQSISLIGTWITRVATSWLVYRLTGSALLLGIAGFAGQIPTLIITPFAGVLVGDFFGVLVGVGVMVGVSVGVGVFVGVMVKVGVCVAVGAFVGVCVGV